MHKENITVAIGLVTSSNLKHRYNKCLETWLKDFENVFMLGGNGNDPNLIALDAGEDWASTFRKQQFGLKHMWEQNNQFDWYNISTCDNILFKDRVHNFLSEYDPSKDLVIGQAGDVWVDNPYLYKPDQLNLNYKCHRSKTFPDVPNAVTFQMLCGGASFFISNSLMSKLYNFIDTFDVEWTKMMGFGTHNYGCSDLALSYMIKKYCGVNLTHSDYMFSQPPLHYISDHDEYDYDVLNNIKSAMSFHYIKPDEMETIYEEYK